MARHPDRFFPADPTIPLASQADDLLQKQKQSWKQLAEGYSSLASVRSRTVDCDGFSVVLQHNPGRMTSTSANVDPRQIRRRPCFLCVENLPPQQEGIVVLGNYLLLGNPFPIFERHYTISHRSHIPQSLEGNIPSFLDLASLVGPGYSVFYNGAKCGASAPDHLHFQACPSRMIPVERDAELPERRERLFAKGDVEVFSLKEYGRAVFVLEGRDKQAVEKGLSEFIRATRTVLRDDGEPMVNIIASSVSSKWRLIIFPRRKHRPEAFDRKDDSQILVSPAAVDMGGLLIVPRESDFRKLDPESIAETFREVSISQEEADQITKSFR